MVVVVVTMEEMVVGHTSKVDFGSHFPDTRIPVNNCFQLDRNMYSVPRSG